METLFSISFNIRTPDNIGTYGSFFIGNDKERAYDVFRKLKGDDNVSEDDLLFIEFSERRDGIPFNLKMRACTLEDLAFNVKIITREAFKIYGIEGREPV